LDDRVHGASTDFVTTRRRRLFLAFRIAGLAILVALVLHRIDPAAVRAAWIGLTPLEAIGIGSAFFVAMSLRIVKWSVQLGLLGLHFDPLLQARNFLLAVLLGAVTPMRVGEVYRLGAIESVPERRGSDLALGAASLLLEKAYEVLVLLALVLVGALSSAPALAAGIAVVLVVATTLGVGSVAPPAGLVERLPQRVRVWIVEPALRARDGLRLRDRIGLVALTAICHFVNLRAGLGIYRAFGPMPWTTFFFRMPLITLTSAIPVSIAGVGLRETVAMSVFGRDGYAPSAAAVAASLMFVGANILPALALIPLEAVLRWRPRPTVGVVEP
jgi:hypothetical protein